jgi:mannosyl-oligosaccharide alpha-1,3-glucosidase
MSECGVIDLFVFGGPRPPDVARQLTRAVGRQALPPVFSLGYHQCRWNYKDEKDVAQVHGKFEELDFPYDVLWLDIEHTDGKRYFTWDKNLFPDPVSMQEALAAQGRKMVTIIDPHIKRDDDYYVHKEATEKGLYIKDKDGNDFDGFCWPGQSSYLDFTEQRVREWWAEQFLPERYNGSTMSLFTWNDMNEPSVFNGPEVSMSKDCKNLAGVEHREWHNLYGMYMHRATADGLAKRKKYISDRPFVLSRSFFVGSQRFGAIWTGDNHASWDHLAIAAPMLLSINIAGLSFAGADVGGFFGDTDAELMTRWMQAGAFQPFFRGHAHHDTKRKEPWVYGEPTTSRIRKAVVARYSLLPYWYLTFYHAYQHGHPVMRPLWFEYPQDAATFAMDDQWLIGKDLLVKPVTAPGVSEIGVYFPGSEPWYDIETLERVQGPGPKKVKAPIDKIPVYQRGGSVIPRKMRLRRSASLMRDDPYTLVVALDKQNHAEGAIYLDDEVTRAHKLPQEFAYVNVTMRDGAIHGQKVAGLRKEKKKNPHLTFKQTIERIVVLGFQGKPSTISITGTVEQTPRALEFDYDGKKKVLTIRKPDVFAVEDWVITTR